VHCYRLVPELRPALRQHCLIRPRRNEWRSRKIRATKDDACPARRGQERQPAWHPEVEANPLEGRRARGEVVTGLLYVDADSADMHAALHTVDMPLNTLNDPDLVPGNAALAAVNASLR